MSELRHADVRAVFFDAVGTLLWPEPSAAAAYARVGRCYGSRLAEGEVQARFAAAFRRQEEVDAGLGHRTSEEREVRRWRAIVGEVLDDVADGEGCFQALYAHFARPAAWRCDALAGEVVGALRGRGLVVGMASNFDSRLRGIVAGKPELAGIQHLAISSELGWKKPAAGFFAALCEMAGVSAGRVLVVGDDEENDYHGARRAGLQALLLGPGARPEQGAQELGEIPGLIGGPE